MKVTINYAQDSLSQSVDGDTLKVGRADTNDFVLPYDELSRQHCQLFFEGDKLFIKDLGSKNGVFIDGARIAPQKKIQFSPSTSVKLANKYTLRVTTDQVEKNIEAMKTKKTQLKVEAPARRTQTKVLTAAEARALAGKDNKIVEHLKVGVDFIAKSIRWILPFAIAYAAWKFSK